MPIWTNRGDKPRDKSFDNRRGHVGTEELSTNVHGVGEVCLVNELLVALLDDYGTGNQFREAVHGEGGKDFLKDMLRLFATEMEQANGVSEVAVSPKGKLTKDMCQRLGCNFCALLNNVDEEAAFGKKPK